MSKYLSDLFLRRETVLTRSEFLVLLSMIWMFIHFFFITKLSYIMITVIAGRQGAESLTKYSLLSNINSNFVGGSVPWSFIGLVLAVLMVRRVYQYKSLVITILIGFVTYISFKLLIFAGPIISGGFAKIWGHPRFFNDLSHQINYLIVAYSFVFIIGIGFLLYPFFTLKNNKQPKKTATQGIDREYFAQLILIFNVGLLLLSIFVGVLERLNLLSHLSPTDGALISLLLAISIIIISVILIWQRLVNAGKSPFYLMYLILFLVISALGVFIMFHSNNSIITLTAPILIHFGILMLQLYICYLYLVPEANAEEAII